ncbi:MAG: hypothetical protein AAF918_07610 [Pseudomonadota bacterium]
MIARQWVKILHSLGAIGLMGAVAAYIVLLSVAPDPSSLAEYAILRRGLEAIARYLLLPSLALVLISGLLSMAVHTPFLERKWAWIKAVLGIAMFEGTLGGVQAPAEQAAKVMEAALTSELNVVALEDLMRHEWGALWVILALSLANVVLAIWRPPLRWPKPRPESPPTVGSTNA